MGRFYKSIISLIMIIVISVPCILIPESVRAETKTAKIHSLIPKVEQYYPGIEDYIADCLRKHQTIIDITLFGVSTDNVLYVFKSAVFTNPDIFYVDASFLKYKFDYLNIVHYIYPKYIVKKSKIPTYVKKFNKAVNNFLGDIDNNLSDWRKALLIHEKMVDNCRYYSGGAITYTAYGAIVNKKSVCEGYTRAYCYLLSKVGIESKCINNEKKLHCWNYVKINNKWYHVDVTSDDPIPDTCGYVSHKYFLISDSKLSSYKSGIHIGYKSDVTYSSAYKCSAKNYNSSFIRNIKSRILLLNNTYYFINNNHTDKHYSAFIVRENNKNKVVNVIKDKWYNKKGKLQKKSFSKLCYLDGYIYLNSKRSIYRYKINNGKLKKVFTMPYFWNNDFYGVMTSGKYILANKKKSVTAEAAKSKILYIRKNNTVFQIPFIRKSSVKIKVKKKYNFKVFRGSGKAVYKSLNNKVARVNSKGVVKALKKGTCTIKAVKNSRTFKLKVKVYKK